MNQRIKYKRQRLFNLISIIRYKYKDSFEEGFYPLKIKSADLNLIYNAHIYK